MGIAELMLDGIRIDASEVSTRNIGTHILIPPEELKKIPKSLVAWSSLQPFSELPVEWLNNTGNLEMVFAGFEPTDRSPELPQHLVHVCLSGIRIYRTCASLKKGKCAAVLVDDMDRGLSALESVASVPKGGDIVFTKAHSEYVLKMKEPIVEEPIDEMPKGKEK